MRTWVRIQVLKYNTNDWVLIEVLCVAETLLFGRIKMYLIYDKNDSDIESL